MTLHMVDISPFIYTGTAVSKEKEYIQSIETNQGIQLCYFDRGGLRFLNKRLIELKQNSNNHVVLFFDNKIEKKISLAKGVWGDTVNYEFFKEGRTYDPYSDNNILRMFLKEVAQYLGFEFYSIKGYEADDLMYTYKILHYNEYDRIYAYTQDCDMFMLVDEKTSILPVNSRGRTITLDNYAETCYKDGYCPWCLSTIFRLCFKKKDGIEQVPKGWRDKLWCDAKEVQDKELFCNTGRTLSWIIDNLPIPLYHMYAFFALPYELEEQDMIMEHYDDYFDEYLKFCNGDKENIFYDKLKDMYRRLYG